MTQPDTTSMRMEAVSLPILPGPGPEPHVDFLFLLSSPSEVSVDVLQPFSSASMTFDNCLCTVEVLNASPHATYRTELRGGAIEVRRVWQMIAGFHRRVCCIIWTVARYCSRLVQGASTSRDGRSGTCCGRACSMISGSHSRPTTRSSSSRCRSRTRFPWYPGSGRTNAGGFHLICQGIKSRGSCHWEVTIGRCDAACWDCKRAGWYVSTLHLFAAVAFLV
jgi:hypothetical protein